VADDVVQLTREPRALLGDGLAGSFLPLVLEPRSSLLGVLDLTQLPPDSETGDPEDGEEQGDPEPVAEALRGIVVRDHAARGKDERQAGDRLP
jgi:hypothetical protein